MKRSARFTFASTIIIILAILCWRAAPAQAWYWYGSTPYSYKQAPTQHPTLSNCDDCTAAVALPFAFPFYGKTYSSVTISSNGFLRPGTWTDNLTFYQNQQLSYDGVPTFNYPVIAPMWDDWDTALSGSVYYGQPVAGGPFIIEWYAVKQHTQTFGLAFSFEVKLFPDGAIEYHYLSVTPGSPFDNGYSATVGFQEGGWTAGMPHAYNQIALYNSTALRWTYPGKVAFYAKVQDAIHPTPTARGNVMMTLNYTCANKANAISVNTGTSWTAWSMAPANPNCAYTDLMSGTPVISYVTDGFDAITVPFGSVSTTWSGTYAFHRRNDITPAPDQNARWNYIWNLPGGGQASGMSKLDYWTSGPLDKPVLIITGFDPLNEDSTASYLALMVGLVQPLMNEGFDVVIGKFAYGDLPLSWFRDEVGAWIGNVYTKVGHKFQVAGVSMGGIVLRHTLASNTNSSASKISAWYSIDAPQKGANLGKGSKALQNLVYCNKDVKDPSYKKLFSLPSKDMNFRTLTSCDCSDDEPENESCTSTAANHDAYYNTVGWPANIPRYAAAFGDGVGTWVSQTGAGSVLFEFFYGASCSADQQWYGGSRDMMAGSKYLDSSMVDTSVDHWWCWWSGVRLKWNPGFINTDSALAGTTVPEYQADGTTAPGYTVTVDKWNGWVANDWNEHHKVVTAGIINQIMAWARIYQ